MQSLLLGFEEKRGGGTFREHRKPAYGDDKTRKPPRAGRRILGEGSRGLLQLGLHTGGPRKFRGGRRDWRCIAAWVGIAGSIAYTIVCAGHGARLPGWKSPGQVYVKPKARRRARASSRGGVRRKPNPKARGDVQEPDLRCGTLGTSWHVTAKSSIHAGGVLYKSGVYARKVVRLTPGGLYGVR